MATNKIVGPTGRSLIINNYSLNSHQFDVFKTPIYEDYYPHFHLDFYIHSLKLVIKLDVEKYKLVNVTVFDQSFDYSKFSTIVNSDPNNYYQFDDVVRLIANPSNNESEFMSYKDYLNNEFYSIEVFKPHNSCVDILIRFMILDPVSGDYNYYVLNIDNYLDHNA